MQVGAKYPLHDPGLIARGGIIYLDAIGVKALFRAVIPPAHNVTVVSLPSPVTINDTLVSSCMLPFIRWHCVPIH